MQFILKFKDGTTYLSDDIDEINGIPCVAKDLNRHIEDTGFLSLFLRDQEKDNIKIKTEEGEMENKKCSELYSVEVVF
ncbi:MAG: hypothetical protein ACQEQP_05595 [Bacillota bacterium]